MPIENVRQRNYLSSLSKQMDNMNRVRQEYTTLILPHVNALCHIYYF